MQEGLDFDPLKHPRDRRGRWRETFGALAREAGVSRRTLFGRHDPGTRQRQSSIAVTPYRGAGVHHDESYFGVTRYKGFERMVRAEASRRGIHITRHEHASGVWAGGHEPSSRIASEERDRRKLTAFMDEIGADYQQDGVIGFIPSPNGRSRRYTTKEAVPRDTVERILHDYPKIPGATVKEDGTLEILFLPHEFESAEEMRAGLAQIGDLLRSLGVRSRYERGEGILRLHPRDYRKRPRPKRRA